MQELDEEQDSRYSPYLIDSYFSSDVIYLCTMFLMSLASSYFPLTHQYVPQVLQAYFSSSSSFCCSFFIHGLGILLTNPFLWKPLLTTQVHCFQGVALWQCRLKRQTLDDYSHVKIYKYMEFQEFKVAPRPMQSVLK